MSDGCAYACGGLLPSPPLPETGAPPQTPLLKRRRGWKAGLCPKVPLLKRRRGWMAGLCPKVPLPQGPEGLGGGALPQTLGGVQGRSPW
ncbi:hypothetical protein GCM10009574_065900 [Streptomyces asiaticus]|uniref:Uncharacterized protein n=2 Tax=Streptomyces rhizosphaericus TaxID=114699 RepID=A0ABN1QNJ2_9ACTN